MIDPVREEYRRLGQKIKLAREDARLTQEELGTQVGVTGSAVTQWEKGNRQIGIPELRRIARILHRPLVYFLGEENAATVSSESPEFDERLSIALMSLGRLPTPEELESIKRFIRFTYHG